MTTRRAIAAVVIVLVVAAGTGAAFVAGVGPFQPSGNGGDVGNFPTETAAPDGGQSTTSSLGTTTAGGGGGAGAATASNAPSGPPFTFQVVETKHCGRTCRDVTVELTNNMDRPAEDVSVYVRIFAGNSTDSGDRIWQAKEDIGRLKPGETVQRTKRVKLSLMEGLSVQQNDGWITIQTTVQSANETQTFTERRDVT